MKHVPPPSGEPIDVEIGDAIPVQPLPTTPEDFFRAWSRKEREQLIEVLISSLDEADADPDLEPSLGAPEVSRYEHRRRGFVWARGDDGDREDDADEENERVDDEETQDAEPDVDDEPSLGSLEHEPQCYWGHGGSEDLEDEHDGSEPSLGWTYGEAARGPWYAGTMGDCVDLEENVDDERQHDEAETGIADAEGLMEQTGGGGGCSGTGFAVTVE